jgi:hypothetical protein
MKCSLFAVGAFLLNHAIAIPSGHGTLQDILLQKKADSSKVGYLAVYWTTSEESVHFALSTNDDPLGFTELNGGEPIATPTVGTGAVRDLSIIAGDGVWYILGTDLKISDVGLRQAHPRDSDTSRTDTFTDQLERCQSQRISLDCCLAEYRFGQLDR